MIWENFEVSACRVRPLLYQRVCAAEHLLHYMWESVVTPAFKYDKCLQVRAQSLNFTTFTWAAQIKQLRQMLITGVSADIDMDWSMSLPSDQAHTLNGSSGYRSPRPFNKSLANVLVLRGNGSQFANVNLFAHESLYPIWSVDGLSVATNPTRLGKYEMAAGLLSNCQSTVLPASRVLSRAYGMFASRAYLHQYYEHGLEVSAFHAAFAVVEDLVARYVTL